MYVIHSMQIHNYLNMYTKKNNFILSYEFTHLIRLKDSCQIIKKLRNAYILHKSNCERI